MLPSRISTERLLLRPATTDDAETIFSLYATDAEVTRYLTWAPHRTVEDTRGFLSICEDAWKYGTSFPYIIERAGDRQLLGMICAEPSHGFCLGYVLARPFWGHEYIAEAAAAIISHAFALDDVYRIWAVCDVRNTASARVMQKIGMQLEGTLRKFEKAPNLSPVPRDVLCYSIVKPT